MSGRSTTYTQFSENGERTGTPDFQCESREQHAAFIGALADDGFVILGGPLGEGEEKFLLIMAAES